MSSRACSIRRPTSATLALVGLLGCGVSLAQATTVDVFLRNNATLCATGPVIQCFDSAFEFVDANGDSRISIEEAQGRQAEAAGWFEANQERLHPIDRQGMALTLLTIQLVGLETLFDGYDFNSDGGLDAIEISADLNLDDRPMPEWIRDPDSVDWTTMTGRLGPAGNLLSELLNATGVRGN